MKMRKVFLGCLSALVISASVAPFNALASSHYYRNDFEGGLSDGFDKFIVTLPNGNRVARGVSGQIKMFAKEPVTEGRFSVSLDANWQDSGRLQSLRLINSKDGKTYLLFGSYAGRVKYSRDNTNDWQPFDGGFEPAADRDYHFDIVIDFGTKSISYYKDGKLWGTAVMNDAISQNGFTGLSFVSDMKTSAASPWYVDNLVMSDIDGFITPTASVNTAQGYVDIDFKTVLSPEDKISLNGRYVKIVENGTPNSLLGVTSVENVSGPLYRIKYAQAPTAGREYYVQFPDALSGILGQRLSDNKIYFSSSGNGAISSVKLIDAEGNESGILTPNDEIAQIKIELNTDAEQSELDGITLTSDGAEVASDRELAGRTYIMKLCDIIGADKECVLTIPASLSGLSNQMRRFTTGSGKFEVRNLEFAKSDGTPASTASEAAELNAEIINTNNEKDVYVVFCAYDGDGKMTDFKVEKADFSAKRVFVEIDNLKCEKAETVRAFVIKEEQTENGAYVRSWLADTALFAAEK